MYACGCRLEWKKVRFSLGFSWSWISTNQKMACYFLYFLTVIWIGNRFITEDYDLLYESTLIFSFFPVLHVSSV